MKQKRFGSFDEKFQLLADTLPMLVSVTKNPDDETDEQFIITHDRFIALNDLVKNKLAAQETAFKIQDIGRLHNLSRVQMSDIARSVRNYYFGELKLNDFPAVLAKEMGIDLARTNEISKAVIEKIINDKSFEEAYQASLQDVPLQEALKKFPLLGEQLITSDKITLKNFPSPVRPSIKNWLADYNFVVGFAKKEGSIGRTNYLFHNINTQKLSQPDRQKLSYILKSFDENSPITVNKNAQQIIFPEVQPKLDSPSQLKNPFSPPKTDASPSPKKFETGTTPPNGGKGGPDVRFTSPQKLPYEKEKNSGLQPYRITPFDTSPRDKAQDDKSQAPKNIINLKE
jgi:hypothetical protein